MRSREETQTQQGNENEIKQQYMFIGIATVIRNRKEDIDSYNYKK